MRSGMLQFSEGCFMAKRIPTTHGTDEMPVQEALEQLAVPSTLARCIDLCELVRVEGESAI
jgi:chorismate mutase